MPSIVLGYFKAQFEQLDDGFYESAKRESYG